MQRINFDQASTSFPKAPGVAEAVYGFLKDEAYNVSRGSYGEAYSVASQVFEARENLAAFFNLSDSKYLIFTPGATVAINSALKGILQTGDHVLCSSVEHNAVMRPLHQLQGLGISYTTVATSSQGILDPQKIEDAIKSNTKAVVMSAASNVIGTFLPIAEVAEICQRKGLFFIVDAAQKAGTFPIDFQALKADVLIVPGHKGLLGPQGIGAMALSPRFAKEAQPLLPGGTGSASHSLDMPTSLPDRFEAGTLNLPGIIGLNAAVNYLQGSKQEDIRKHELALTQMFIQGLHEIPTFKPEGLLNIESRSPVVSVSLTKEGDLAEVADLLERRHGIMTRVGLHCAPLAHQTIGTFPAGTIRFSFSHKNTVQEVEYCLEALKTIYE